MQQENSLCGCHEDIKCLRYRNKASEKYMDISDIIRMIHATLNRYYTFILQSKRCKECIICKVVCHEFIDKFTVNTICCDRWL